jgi:hypothetical protein
MPISNRKLEELYAGCCSDLRAHLVAKINILITIQRAFSIYSEFWADDDLQS